jgi:hypothetical protein
MRTPSTTANGRISMPGPDRAVHGETGVGRAQVRRQIFHFGLRVIEEILPEFTLTANGAPPKMISVLQSKVRPDKVSEYMDMVRSEVFPAAKKSGLKEFSIAQERYGAPSTEFVSVAGMDSWGDFDGEFGVPKGMGKEGYQKFLLKIRPLIVESQWDVYRFQPDLSYLRPAMGK